MARRDILEAVSRMVSKVLASSMTIASTSSVSQSRMTRSHRSGSWKMQHGVLSVLTLPCISFHTETRFLRSRANARADAPAPTVRTTSPTFSGSGSLSSIFFSLLRSSASPIFFETPRILVPGIMTR